MLYAVVLVGIPGTIINGVLEELRNSFNDTYVFRGAGVVTRKERLTEYDDETIAGAVRLAANAVFGKSERPYGFCRHSARPCALRNKGKTCGASDGASCGLLKPAFFTVIYQSGVNSRALLEGFHFSAHFSSLTPEVYGAKNRTIDAIKHLIYVSEEVLGLKRQAMSTKKSPLLLPPQNFRQNKLTSLLRIHNSEFDGNRIKQFRNEFYDKGAKAYKSEGKIVFKPAEREGEHGLPHLDRDCIALSHHYRLGTAYEGKFHFDAQHNDGTDLNGKRSFTCRKAERTIWPSGSHQNVLIDDCLAL